LVTLSAGALLDHMELIERAAETGAGILVPTGALLGLDAVRATAEGTIRSVKLVSRKPPSGLVGAPYLRSQQFDPLQCHGVTHLAWWARRVL
jgi:aspartate dehydrogenase